MANQKSGGVSFLGLLFLLFLGLKLTNQIDWSWWWVTSPLWLPLALYISFVLLIILAVLIVSGVAILFGKNVKSVNLKSSFNKGFNNSINKIK